jgi:hypothetical protein
MTNIPNKSTKFMATVFAAPLRAKLTGGFCVLALLALSACAPAQRLSASWSTDTENALSQSRWYEAETLLQQGYQRNANDLYVLNNLGLVYQKTGRPDLARQYYERVIASNTEEARSPYGQELRRIAQANLDTLRTNPYGTVGATNTKAPATPAVPAATALSSLGFALPTLPAAGATPPAAPVVPPVPQAVTPPAVDANSAARVAAARLAQIPTTPAPAPVVAPVSSAPSTGAMTTVVQAPGRAAAALASGAGVIAASTSTAAASAGRISAQTSAQAAPSVAVQTEVSTEMQKWATAWVDKDLPTYYGHYTPEFKGTNSDNKAWRAAREQVISSRKAIQLELKDLKFSNAGQDRVMVEFIQNYQSDALKDSIKKSMVFAKQGARWLIQSESNR